MKKTMFLSLAVPGMVVGSIAIVQPAKADGPCTHFKDQYGCDVADCGECIAWSCNGGPTNVACTE
ncbi:MAG: hypothetical protein LPK25_00350 [Cyclobacteriaceae bacterium]|nr:hypothetical protein [Cyclobacteriaceae bacterium]MDX5465282.1 hypothetical protein [Cyclobacteriaceae bacterium]